MTTFNTTVGTPIFFGFEEDDQNGHPLPTPVPGSTIWFLADPHVGVLTASPSGKSVTYVAGKAGTDSLTMQFTMSGPAGGVTFTSNTVTVVVT